MIKYIIFDLAEVCMSGLHPGKQALAKHLKTAPEEISSHFDKYIVLLFEGKMSEDEFLEKVISENKYPLTMDFIKKLIRDNFYEISGTAEIIKRLRKNNYPIALLSDHTKEWIEHIEKKFDFFDLFDVKCYSFESGLVKLKPEFFKVPITKLGANPEETLFIDDYELNIKAAKKAGIKYTIKFKDSEQLKEELIKLKVNIN